MRIQIASANSYNWYSNYMNLMFDVELDKSGPDMDSRYYRIIRTPWNDNFFNDSSIMTLHRKRYFAKDAPKLTILKTNVKLIEFNSNFMASSLLLNSESEV